MPPELPDLLEPRERRHPLWFRALCVLGAIVFFLLGIVGWLIPLVTGIPFYAVSLVLLGMASDRTRQWINDAERKMPDGWRRALRKVLRKPH
jgi:uncharacterized membrane protein YbaN (DUF454 family)